MKTPVWGKLVNIGFIMASEENIAATINSEISYRIFSFFLVV
jgi:hypothetical protein